MLALRSFGFALLVLLSPRLAGEDSSHLARETREAFGWFDQLGFPDLKELPFVRVATGWWHRAAAEEAENTYLRAFLLKDEGKAFTVLSEDLEVRRFQKSQGNTPQGERVGYESLDLKVVSDDEVKKLNENPDGDHDDLFPHGPKLEMPARIFVLSRACERKGLRGEAQALYGAASKVFEARRNHYVVGEPRRAPRESGEKNGLTLRARSDGEKPGSFREALSVQIAHVVFWRAILDFQNPEKTRKDLLDTLVPFADRFPESEHAGKARQMVPVLERMVHEDEEHSKDTRPLPTIPAKERISVLIYKLRDQGCQVFSRPGNCDIFSGWSGLPPSRTETEPSATDAEVNPAQELADLGYEACPQLMNALDDDRLTRAVDSFRDHFFSHRVMTVGDCAHEILERIAGWQFYRRFLGSSRSYNADWEAKKKAIRKWWGAFQEKGEKEMLIDGTASGDETSHYQADRLIERFPEAAAEAIQRGIDGAKNQSVRTELLRTLEKLGGKASARRLQKEVTDGQTLGERVTAAKARFKQDRAGVISAMIGEWASLRNSNTFAKSSTSLTEESAQEDLLEFLAKSDSPDAIRALGQNVRTVPMNFRRKLVDEIQQSLTGFLSPRAQGSRPAIEELLVGLLDDKEETQVVGTDGNVHPRICDLAAEALAQGWPEKHRYQIAASIRAHDRMVAEMKNAWRKEQGLEITLLPRGPRTWPAPEKEASPLLKSIETAASATETEESLLCLEKLGLGVLPLLRQSLEGLAKDHPAREGLNALANRFESMVGEVDFFPEAAAGGESLKALLKDMEGKPIEPGRIAETFAEFAANPSPGTFGLELTLSRPGPGAPLTLTARLVKEEGQERVGRETGWIPTIAYSSGKGAGGGSMGGFFGRQEVQSSGAYPEIQKALKDHLAASVGQRFLMKITLREPEKRKRQ